MERTEYAVRRSEAATAFDDHEQSTHGGSLAISLCGGLTTLRNLVFTRVHDDVESNIGADSMILPTSPVESEKLTKIQIEIFQVAQSTAYVRHAGLVSDSQWYADWLGQLRLAELIEHDQVRKRLDRYLRMTEDDRRQAFSRALEKTFPEATRAPLVLYRLIPLAIDIVTAVAFGENLDAVELRNRQTSWLPAIVDCHECHGRPLDNGDRCKLCGNPVWTWTWLRAAD